MSRRMGNCWLSVSQSTIDEYRQRKQDEANDIPYTGPMDDESYRIFKENTQDGTVIGQYGRIGAPGPDQLRLYSMYGEASLKSDIDYLIATWDDIDAQGSWWLDTGTQGGMQEPIDPEVDPTPTGTPFYPIRNNLWMFMPEDDGATSNADLRDVNVLQGQRFRDFTQY